MKPGIFKVNQDGANLSATLTVKPSLALKISLLTLNILLLAVIILFTIGGIGVIVLFILAFEVMFLRYSVWNLYGSETIVLKPGELSYQQKYGPVKLAVKTAKINKTIKVIPFHENFQPGNHAVKLIFESLDSDNEPVNLYQTALAVAHDDYISFMRLLNQTQIK